MDTANEGLSLVESDGTFSYVNPAFAELFEYDSDELIDDHWTVLYHNDAAERLEHDILPAVLEQGYWSGETVRSTKHGDRLVTDHRLSHTGEDVIVCTAQDVTQERTDASDRRTELERIVDAMEGREFFTEEDCEKGLPEQLIETAKTAGTVSDTGPRVPNDGSPFECVEALSASYDAAGTIRGFGVMVRKATEDPLVRELQRKTRYLDAIMEYTHRPMFRKDTAGEYLLANSEYRELFDLQEETIIGQTDYDIHSRDVADEVWENDRRVLDDGEPIKIDERMVVDGAERIYAKNRDDEVLLSNEANATLHGMTPEEIEGTREAEIESSVENIENFDKYRQREIEVMETGTPMTFEEQLTDPDGEQQVFETTRIPFEATGRGEEAVLGYARTVTDRKEYERELEQTNKKLEQFAGVVSHDLRNPLTVARGYAEELGPYVDEEGQQFVEEINRSHERMQTMIDELLVLSRAGGTVDDPERVALADVASESWDTTTTDGVDIELEVPETVTIEADRSRLRHVCENLIRNAVDHNDPPLTIRVGTLEDSDGTDGAATDGFFISDDGDGIPENERDDIFEHGYTTDEEGTGFGLSIVAEIVDAHGWDVDITESNDGGARFEIIGVETGN